MDAIIFTSLMLIRIVVLVVLIGFAPAHPTRRSLHEPFARIYHWMCIHILARHIVSVFVYSRVDAGNVAVDINALPVALRDVICLVIDRHVRVLLDGPVPPIPSLAMIFGMSELVQAFCRLEVANFQDFVVCRACGTIDPARNAQEAELFRMCFQILHHASEIAIDLVDAGCEHS